jgi:hypothetical protein
LVVVETRFDSLADCCESFDSPLVVALLEALVFFADLTGVMAAFDAEAFTGVEIADLTRVGEAG